MFDKVFVVVFQGYDTITCTVNVYSIKYISSFCVLHTFFVYNILDSFCCSFICCSYYIVQEVIVFNLVHLYIFEVLCAGVSVLFDDFLLSSFCLIFFESYFLLYGSKIQNSKTKFNGKRAKNKGKKQVESQKIKNV